MGFRDQEDPVGVGEERMLLGMTWPLFLPSSDISACMGLQLRLFTQLRKSTPFTQLRKSESMSHYADGPGVAHQAQAWAT